MDASAHIPVEGAPRLGCGCGPAGSGSDDSLARNVGRMCGHIMAAIRAPVHAAARPLEAGAGVDGSSSASAGTVVARRVQRCDVRGPEGITLRRTVVDEIVAPEPDSTLLRDHHAS